MTNDKDNRKQPTEKEAQNHRHHREGLTPEELKEIYEKTIKQYGEALRNLKHR